MKNWILSIYCLILVCATVQSLRNPAYNWDMLPYMGVILSYDQPDNRLVQGQVYGLAKEQVPAVFYNRMIDPRNAYRNGMAQDPAVFRSQFPFYVVKPLYTRIGWLLYKAGIALSLATVWPSVMAYFLTGLLLFFWLKKYWPGWRVGAGCSLIMLSPPVLTVAGLSTPDALSGLLLFSAVYFLVEKKSIARGLIFLLLAVFTRLDNILPALFFLSAVFFTGKWHPVWPAGKIIFSFILLLLAYFVVAAGALSFGWNIWYYPAFVKHLSLSHTPGSIFDPAAYIALVKSQLTTGLYFSFISLFLFLVLFLFAHTGAGDNRRGPEQIFALLFVLVIAVRFVLQPLVADRLYIPYYLSVMAFLVKKYPVALKWQPA